MANPKVIYKPALRRQKSKETGFKIVSAIVLLAAVAWFAKG